MMNYPVILDSQYFNRVINIFKRKKPAEYLFEELVGDRDLGRCSFTMVAAKLCVLLWLAWESQAEIPRSL